MNQNIKILVPKSVPLHKIIADKYTDLYKQYRAAYPLSRNYTLTKLRANIANVYSVVRQSFPQTSFKPSTYDDWAAKGWYDLSFRHWYFGISLCKDKKNNIRARINDAHYESDHHNDTITSKPYDENVASRKLIVTSRDIKRMVLECLKRILKE